MMDFGQTLQQRRKEKGYSQEALAFELNVSRQAVSKWESSQGYPETEKLLQISSLLDISLDELLKGKPQANQEEAEPVLAYSAPHASAFEDIPEPKNVYTTEPFTQEEQSLFERFSQCSNTEDIDDYLDKKIAFGRGIGLGVLVIIASVGISGLEFILGESITTALLLLGVGVGVMILIFVGMNSVKLTEMEKKGFHLDPELYIDLREERDRYKRVFAMQIALGVFLLLVGVALSSVIGIMFPDAEAIAVLGCCSLSVYLFISAGIKISAYDILLKMESD